MRHVEIVSIGNELLRGIVQESNAHWIAKRLAARGASLERVVLLPDDVEVVAAAIRDALGRAPVLLLTHGGLGPTDDDRTREAIARGTGLPLEPHPDAESIVLRRFRELAAAGITADATMTEARRRMTILPRGARALDNRVGTAPGVVVAHGSTTIVALPGVPAELRWIWEHPLSPLLDELLGPGGFAEVTLMLDLRDESGIATLLAEVQQRHPGVYVKSRAKGFEQQDLIRVTLAATASSDAAARAAVAGAEADVRVALAAVGIGIREPQ